MIDKRIINIPKGKQVFMSYPRIQCLMSGLNYASQNRKGIITLVYSDGTKEQRKADFYIEDKNCFEVVSFVQAGRKDN